MMLTRCPACQTVFRLHPAQLRARNGEVRCGHCFNPFNALQHRIDAPDEGKGNADGPPPRASANHEPTVAAAAEALHHPERTSAGDALDFELPEFPPFDSTPVTDTTLLVEPEARAFGIEPSTIEEPTATSAAFVPMDEESSNASARFAEDTTPDALRPAAMPEVIRAARRSPSEIEQAEPEAPATSPQPGHDPAGSKAPSADEGPPEAIPALWAAEAETPVSEARHVNLDHLDATYGRPRRKASPWIRTLGGMAAGLLTGTLAVQSIYLFRTDVSRQLPGLRPMLEAACANFHCEVPLPQDIGQIGIETSDLQSEPGHPGRYVLHSSVKNRADYPQAWPHLELTLTDATDTPVARRTLAPAEWVPAGQLGPSFTARTTIAVRLPFELDGASPTGYRVYVFYP